ncbi:hypothetical protein EOM82_04630 [bacterium]|nr:hypothetical protein [bacterium]
MKKVILIILILSTLLMCACGTGNSDTSSQESNSSEEKSKQEESSEQIEPDITTTVTRDFVDERYSKILMGFDLNPVLSSIQERSKTGLPEDYVSDHEKNIDEYFYYRMFKVDDGGYFYVFIRKLQQSENIDPQHIDTVSHFAYVEKPMKMNDFNDLSVGDTLEDVIAIDPGARYVKDYAIVSLHLCSDGLVVIGYDEYIEGQGRKILSIDYSEDYTFLRNDNAGEYSDESGEVYTVGYPYYSCAIAPEDYPKE